MVEISTIGLDLAKTVFQVHGVSFDGAVAVKRQLRRSEVLTWFGKQRPCLVGLKACGGVHYWAREIRALGHQVRLIPPAYVKPYVKRGKTDAADAEAICEAVTRSTMHFVPIKSAKGQAEAMLLKTRDLLVRQRTMTVNALRGHFGELGIVTGKGVARTSDLVAIVRDQADARLSSRARAALTVLAEQIEALSREIVEQVRRDEEMRRLTAVPGIGPITAAAIKALVPDIVGFTSARHFAAWIGLTPRLHSSGGKKRLGKISKMGNTTLRTLLVPDATDGAAPCAKRRKRAGMGHRSPEPAPAEGRRRGLGQQDGADRLRDADQGHALPQTGSSEQNEPRCRLTRETDFNELPARRP